MARRNEYDNQQRDEWVARQQMRKLRVEEVLRELDRAQKIMIESERQRRAVLSLQTGSVIVTQKE